MMFGDFVGDIVFKQKGSKNNESAESVFHYLKTMFEEAVTDVPDGIVDRDIELVKVILTQKLNKNVRASLFASQHLDIEPVCMVQRKV